MFFNQDEIRGGRRTSMSAEKREAAYTEQVARLTAEAARKSTAAAVIDRKHIETVVRDLMMVRGIGKASDVRARRADKADVVWYEDGYRLTAEIKTGGNFGTPAAPVTITVEPGAGRNGCDRVSYSQTWTWDDIAPTADVIVFPIVDAIESLQDLKDCTAVMPRMQFIDILQSPELTPRGGQVFHITGDGANGVNTPVITFQAGPLKRLRNLLMHLIATGDVDTLQTWLIDHGRE